jgi:hypothetical protein
VHAGGHERSAFDTAASPVVGVMAGEADGHRCANPSSAWAAARVARAARPARRMVRPARRARRGKSRPSDSVHLRISNGRLQVQYPVPISTKSSHTLAATPPPRPPAPPQRTPSSSPRLWACFVSVRGDIYHYPHSWDAVMLTRRCSAFRRDGQPGRRDRVCLGCWSGTCEVVVDSELTITSQHTATLSVSSS